MAKRVDALVTPEMLEWARRRAYFNMGGAAKRLGVTVDRLESFESGEKKPTILQAVKMAKLYRVPLSAFYLDAPPTDSSVVMTDFRRLPERSEGQSPALAKEIDIALARQQIVIDLSDDPQEGRFPLNEAILLSDPQDAVVRMIREALRVTWAEQKSWRTRYDALNNWRLRIESFNVLVFHTNHLGDSVPLEEMRGFSIGAERFPVIVLNSADSVYGRVFTLLHELTHLMLGRWGICDTSQYLSPATTTQQVEVFCNSIAGSVLVPGSILLAHDVVSSHGESPIWTEHEIDTLSHDFSTSNEVIVRRLLTLGLTSDKFYEQRRQEYQERFLESRRSGNSEDGSRNVPPYYRMVLRRNGKPYTRRVLDAYNSNQITLSSALGYLDIKVKHLDRVLREVYSP